MLTSVPYEKVLWILAVSFAFKSSRNNFAEVLPAPKVILTYLLWLSIFHSHDSDAHMKSPSVNNVLVDDASNCYFLIDTTTGINILSFYKNIIDCLKN